MRDLTLVRSGELMVTQVIGNTPAGIEFVDRWVQEEMVVVDAGAIIVRGSAPLEAQAQEEGLTIERDMVAVEKQDDPGRGAA
jgi:hypothetical protein